MKSEEREYIVKYRTKRSRETIEEIGTLLDQNLINTATNRIYYACFYAVGALLIKNGIYAKTHAGVRQMFNLHFIKPGKIAEIHGSNYSRIFGMRHASDCGDFFDYSRNDIEILIPRAKALISDIEN